MLKSSSLWLFFFIVFSISKASVFGTGCQPPCLYISNLTNIVRVPLNETTGKIIQNRKPKVIYDTDGHIRSLDLDPLNKRLYYGDFWYHTLNSSDLDGGNQRTLLKYAVGYVQGISVDWTSNNVYWTDSLMDFIEVADFEGKNRKILFKLEDGAEPRGIVVNHVTGQLFWTDWGKMPKIERSTLSGTDRVTIVSSNLRWPNDLAIDYKNKRLFWIDAYHDKLYSCDYDGNNQNLHYEIIYNRGLVHPYSLAYSSVRKQTYYSDWQTNNVYVDTKMDGQNISIVYNNGKGKKRNLGQIRLLEKKQLEGSKVCVNHTCSHMCFNDGANKHACGCPTGMELSSDQMNCQGVSRAYEMYFADSLADTVHHLIKYKSQDGFSIRELPQPTGEDKLHSPIAIDFDPITRFVYMSDVGLKKMYRMHEDGGKSEAIITGQVTYGLAVDHINRLLYWFEDDKHLVVSSMDGQNKKILMQNLESPRDIALYEEKGYVYFNDFKYGRIYRINADGTGLMYLQTKSRILVTGIAVDKIEDRVYWCDRDKYSVEYTDLDFKNRRKIIQKTLFWAGKFWLMNDQGFVIRPFDISVLGDRIFWSDTYKRAIYSANKNSGGEIEYVTGGLDHPRDVHVFNDEIVAEYKTIHLVTHLPSSNRARALCYNSCPSTYSYFPDPGPCPTGYKETRFNQTCANCSDAFGGNFKCECKDWLTCAQRGSGRFFGCHPEKPMMVFKVRECKQVVNPGYCPYHIKMLCHDSYNTSKLCASDNDCNGNQKCCQDACGNKLCNNAIQKSDHPCTMNNGGCSHFCVVDSKSGGAKCLCPDNMGLDADKQTCKIIKDICPKFDIISTCVIRNDSCTNDEDCKEGQRCCSKGCGLTCVNPVKSVCMSPSDRGVCFRRTIRWYFNKKSKKCESFIYGGCGGNGNNFLRESDCRKSCMPQAPSTKCPKFFIGEDCNINVEKGTSSIVLKTIKTISKHEFIQSIARHLTDYCQANDCESVNEKARRRRRLSVPPKHISPKDVYIFDYVQTNNELRVTFAVLFDQNGKQVVMSKDSVKNAASSAKLVDGQSGKAQFVSLDEPSKGKNKKNTRVNIVVGIIIALIVLVALGAALWYIKKKRLLEKNTSSQASGPVTFENRLYSDLHNDKVQLPNESNGTTEPRYATANSNALAEYASPMPPLATLSDYAEVAAAPSFVLPTYEQVTSPVGNEKSKDWVKFETEKNEDKKWVQFTEEDENTLPIGEFGESNYTDPYDMDKVHSPDDTYPPPLSKNDNASIASIRPELSHSVSLGDLKKTDDSNTTLPVVGEESPRKAIDYENIMNQEEITTKIDVKTSASEC